MPDQVLQVRTRSEPPAQERLWPVTRLAVPLTVAVVDGRLEVRPRGAS